MVLLLLVYGNINGTFTCLGTIINLATAKYGFTSGNASLFGGLFILGGVIGSVLYAVYLEKTHNYKLAMI